MARILVLELPGGNDFTVIEDAVQCGHEVVFCTGDLAHYQGLGTGARACLASLAGVIEVSAARDGDLQARVLAAHARTPFDALLCLIDIRMVEASDLAARLGLRFLSPATARLMRDKFRVREVLARRGVRQPRFALVSAPRELAAAVDDVGFPALVKPADGYGSQNVGIVRSRADVEAFAQRLALLCAQPADYGLGVHASSRFAVEQYVEGTLIGCDVFSSGEGRFLLGINDKRMFPPPSFAIRGSCFPSDRYDSEAIGRYAFEILDAVDFDFGASHIEMIVSDGVPWLVEVNPRLVSAQIPFQMGYALERSVYAALIDLHLGAPLQQVRGGPARWFSATRWFVAPREGVLQRIHLPEAPDPLVRRVVLFKGPGDAVRPPVNNGDRLGYVIAVGTTQADAERLAESYVGAARVELRDS